MGYIKEPDGVDFVINSRSLTKKEEIAISEYIRDYKAKHAQNKVPAKHSGRKTSTRKKVVG